MPGIVSGKVTVRNTLSLEAPRLNAASSMLRSTLASMPRSVR
ncbi:MAG: hypothetical protein BWY85_01615 [Firmicutes bacterium ADurb.Bin506]|nr:MAG: hypothetical protein BWY85_01615 [Firmicutes bacterium ADurb.Bin506]